MNKHYVIIVNYNSDGNLIACIDSILHSRNIRPHIVVIDNASRDNSLEKCKVRFPNLTYIYNTHNIGFSAAANIGARFALERNADTVTFCNPDATLEESCLSKLISTIKQEEADIISPIIYYFDSPHIWFNGGKISFLKQRAVHTKKLHHDTIPYKTGYVSGCVMTVAARVFEKIGLFDEKFFLYYEDADFSFRAKKAGFSLLIHPQAQSWHKEVSEQENLQKIYFLVLSGLIFFHKHSKGLRKIWFHIYLMLRKIKNNIGIKNNVQDAQQVSKAFLDYEKHY